MLASLALGFFYRRLRAPEVAADLMAETVATMFEKRDRFRDIGHPASAWIFTIAARQLPRSRRRKTVEMNAVAPGSTGDGGQMLCVTWGS